tara:strand:+ start:864 stop:1265 length:402 start_codon:yes stop_codon:yes gene_type:complete
MKILLATLLALTPVSATADEYQAGYSSSKTCYRSEYREEYVPGNENNPGYVKSWKETIEFPCNNNSAKITQPTRTVIERHYEVDDNDCSEGTLAGGLLGGGLATSVSRGKDRWWAIPTGIVGGAMLGCSLDGG